MVNRAGVKRRILSGEAAYESFVPTPLPPVPPIAHDDEALRLLIDANRQLADLEAISKYIPNVRLFMAMYIRKEALMSSQIEGTQATLEDVLDPAIDLNVNRDVADVINYVKATEYAINRLRELPLCNRLLRETHAVLMKGVRGQEKNPGEFRRSQNWIGSPGGSLKNARYIPPSPEDMIEAISDLEKYINGGDGLDVLVRAALIHYQFETIHPFLDGNGRIGRLLIILFLMEKRFLTSPALYVSLYLKKNRIEYYDRMTEVRDKGDYEQWVKFFLRALYESAYDAATTIGKLNELRNANTALIDHMGRSAGNTRRLFYYLEANPIIEIRKTAAALNMAFNTISAAINRLTDAGILEQISGKRRYRAFCYKKYIELLREGT